jgi:hypothetical protein
MNSILERVNTVCRCVQELSKTTVSFRKLVALTRQQFRLHDIDITLRSRIDRVLDQDQFYVMAYYDPEDDYLNETPIEIIVHHNFKKDVNFNSDHITEFLIQIYDAVVHEFRHQLQSRQRYYEIYSDHLQTPFAMYLADPDEVDAYALSIAIELLRAMPASRAKRFMTRLSVLSKLKQNNRLVSVNLRSYVSYFHNTKLLRTMSKKIYKHLETIDKRYVFL